MALQKRINLCGPWTYQPDPYAQGERAGYFRDEFDRSRFKPVRLPRTFDDCAEEMGFYEGTVWFARTFRVPTSWGRLHAVLRFLGVNTRAKVWLNGAEAGETADPFLPFESDVSDLLRPGAVNTVVVKVDNAPRYGEVPPPLIGWRNFGGILREVELVATDRLFIRSVVARAEPADGGGRLAVRATVANTQPKPVRARLTVRLVDAAGAALAELGAQDAALAPGQEVELAAEGHVPGVTPWSPDEPNLYTVQVALAAGGRAVHAKDVRVGFRTVQARADRLYLNGQPIFLMGFNRHEDSPRTTMATDLATARQDLIEMKAAGANFVRLCHYPHHGGELDLCDELGLLAMGEIPLYWWGRAEKGFVKDAARDARTLQSAQRQLTTMIQRDMNHPSVIFWSVGNENDETNAEVVEVHRRLLTLARQLDPTRLAVHVSQEWPRAPHFEDDDVICVNAYPSWGVYRRGGGPEADLSASARFWREQLAKLHEACPGKPILVTEFGFRSHQGIFGGGYGEDVQAKVIEAEFAAMDAPYVCGATIWCWADHAWPAGRLYSVNGVEARPAISPWGVCTRRREKLAAYETIRRVFTARGTQSDLAEGG